MVLSAPFPRLLSTCTHDALRKIVLGLLAQVYLQALGVYPPRQPSVVLRVGKLNSLASVNQVKAVTFPEIAFF